MVAVCVTDVVATEVAVSVTLRAVEEGRAVGAVYPTDRGVTLERAPQPVPEQPEPVSFQVTPWFFVSPPSTAVKVSS